MWPYHVDDLLRSAASLGMMAEYRCIPGRRQWRGFFISACLHPALQFYRHRAASQSARRGTQRIIKTKTKQKQFGPRYRAASLVYIIVRSEDKVLFASFSFKKRKKEKVGATKEEKSHVTIF